MRELEPQSLKNYPFTRVNRATILKQNYQNSIALPFEQVLPAALIEKVLQEQGVRYRQTLYTPIVVIWAWLLDDNERGLDI